VIGKRIDSAAHPITKHVKTIRFTGILLVVISAIIFSSAGLFVKGVSANAWIIIFWRGLFAAIFTSVYILLRGQVRRQFREMGKPGVSAALIGALGTIAFIPSFKYTSIANVSLIYAASPFIAAGIMWLWTREKPGTAILLSSLIALIGVLIIFSGSMGGVHLTGDLLALWMTIAMAAYLCIYRRYPDTPAAGPAVLLSLFLVPVALLFTNPFSAPLAEIAIMASFGLVFSIASVTLAEGAKRLPAAETALVSSLEIPLAPFWAWLLFTEIPTFLTVIGGAIILLAVYGSQLFG